MKYSTVPFYAGGKVAAQTQADLKDMYSGPRRRVRSDEGLEAALGRASTRAAAASLPEGNVVLQVRTAKETLRRRAHADEVGRLPRDPARSLDSTADARAPTAAAQRASADTPLLALCEDLEDPGSEQALGPCLLFVLDRLLPGSAYGILHRVIDE